MKRRVVIILVILVLAAVGAEPVGADMRGEVVCDVPANEAVLITRQLDNGSWRIWTPVAGSAIPTYPTEEAALTALARWNPSFVCEVTIRVNFREFSARFYRLGLEMMSGVIAGESEDPRILIVGVPEGTVEAFRDCRSDMCPEMVMIPAGLFRMGCVSGKGCESDEKPAHEVRIASVALSKYEVTFEEYDRFSDATGRERADDEGWGRGRRPVINVSWDDAVAYAKWLSDKTGKSYRLPTESEWEYAVRSGTTTMYSWGNELDSNRTNCNGCGNEPVSTVPVGSFNPNDWGLYDMHGNVWEWVQDCYNDSYQGAPMDGSAWENNYCQSRVFRGGSIGSRPWELRCAYRNRTAGRRRSMTRGFRVARTLAP